MSTTFESELRSILAFTVNLARTAGTLILEGSQAIHASSDVNEKKNSVDLVTQYDVAVENLVMDEIKKAYPTFKLRHHQLRARLSVLLHLPWSDLQQTPRPWRRVQPVYRVSVHGDRRPRIVPHPRHRSTSKAPSRIPQASPLHIQSPDRCRVGFRPRNPHDQRQVDSFLKLAGDSSVPGGRMAQSLRSMGSAALNFSMVAQGGLDMYWEIGCWPWDVCAGMVIAQEAGGVVTGSHDVLNAASEDVDPFKITPEILTGRKYLVIRGIPDMPNETGREAQLRIAKEFYATVNDTEPK
ncbi:myo inositol monophosphatase [Boletus reticuloceps]|uniref:Myo inositol monophosphatase n=1 Tax=Boletus reticuloceps TaxID=495285 RepID=A0A8I3AES0_9AGAM|nr:myo inositol monophosphatase [Boletus reticuloceps]